jgi:hypothetical protein
LQGVLSERVHGSLSSSKWPTRVFYPVVEATTNLVAIDIHATIWARLLWILAANNGHGLVVDIDPALGQQVLAAGC